MKQYIAWPTSERDIVRARIAAHRAADEIVQGTGFADGKGCAVGCSLDNYSHDEYSRVLGVDLRIAKLVDAIHEGLPRALALDWPARVASALHKGADVTLAADRFAVWLLEQGACGKSDHCSIVSGLFRSRLCGNEPAREQWQGARRTAAYAADAAAAYTAAAYTADAAAAYAYAADAYAYAAAAAYAADAYAYAAYAAAAADAAAADAAYADARRAFWASAATALEEIITRCEVPQ